MTHAFPFSDYQAISAARGIRFILLFISLLAQRNEPKKGHPVSLVPPRRDALRSSMLPGLCKLGFASNSAKPFFGSLSGARLRANGILTAYERNLTKIAWQSNSLFIVAPSRKEAGW
jgi:hypothetical protein